MPTSYYLLLAILAAIADAMNNSGGMAKYLHSPEIDIMDWFGFLSFVSIMSAIGYATWQRSRPIDPMPETLDDLMLESAHARARLTAIECRVRERLHIEAETDAADVVMHAVRDGYGWSDVRKMERDGFVPKWNPNNRVKRWI